MGFLKSFMYKGITIFGCYSVFQIESRRVIESSISGQSGLREMFSFLFPISFANWVLFIFIIYFLLNKRLDPIKRFSVVSSIFSGLMVMGTCYSKVQGLFMYITNFYFDFVIILLYMGYYTLFLYAFDLLEKIKQWCQKKNVIDTSILTERYLIVKAAILMGIFWMPYIAIRYPAGIEWDGYHQILQFMGKETLSAHWPLLSTYIIGQIVRIGYQLFDSYEQGVFFFVLLQSIICISILSYSLGVMKQIGCSGLQITLTLMIYSFVPFFPGFYTSIVKDALFSIAVLLEIILLVENLYLNKNRHISFFVCAAFVCLLRNNGVYIELALLIFGVFELIQRNRKVYSMVIAAMFSVMVSICYTHIYIPSLNLELTGPGLTYEQDHIKEMLSIPFQQTARFLAHYPDDVSDEERKIIGQVLDVDTIAHKYNPLLSDNVKGTYHGNKDSLKAYLKVWTKMFFIHPDIYFDAAGELCYGFFYPNVIQRDHVLPGIYIGTNATEQIYLVSPEWLKPFVSILEYYGYFWERVPAFSFFYNTAIQIWFVIWMVVVVVYRRDRAKLIILVPSIIGVLVCIASPTWWHNGFRYALPIICANPFIYAIVSKK